MKKPYQKFSLMMTISFIILHATMFLNAAARDHVMLSHTRTGMTLLMVAPMAEAQKSGIARMNG